MQASSSQLESTQAYSRSSFLIASKINEANSKFCDCIQQFHLDAATRKSLITLSTKFYEIWCAYILDNDLNNTTKLIHVCVRQNKHVIMSNQSIFYYGMFMFSDLVYDFFQALKCQLNDEEFKKIKEDCNMHLEWIATADISNFLKKLNPTQFEYAFQYVKKFYSEKLPNISPAVIRQSMFIPDNSMRQLSSTSSHPSQVQPTTQVLRNQSNRRSNTYSPITDLFTQQLQSSNLSQFSSAPLQTAVLPDLVDHSVFYSAIHDQLSEVSLQPNKASFFSEDEFLRLNPEVETSLAKQIYHTLHDSDVLDAGKMLDKIQPLVEILQPFDRHVDYNVCRSFLFFPGTIHVLLTAQFHWIMLSRQAKYFYRFIEILDYLRTAQVENDRFIVTEWCALIKKIYRQLDLYLTEGKEDLGNPNLLLSSVSSSDPLYSISQTVARIYLCQKDRVEQKQTQQLEKWTKKFHSHTQAQLDHETATRMVDFLKIFWISHSPHSEKSRAIENLFVAINLFDIKVLESLLHFPGATSFYFAHLFYCVFIIKSLDQNSIDNLPSFLLSIEINFLSINSNKNKNNDVMKLNLWISFITKIINNLKGYKIIERVQDLRVMYDITFEVFNVQVEDGKLARKVIQKVLLELVTLRINDINCLIDQYERQTKFSNGDVLLDTLYTYIGSITDSHSEAQAKMRELFSEVFCESILATANCRSLIPCDPLTFYVKIAGNRELFDQFSKIIVHTLLNSGQPNLQNIIQLPPPDFQDVLEEFIPMVDTFHEFIAAIKFIEPYFYEYHKMRNCEPQQRAFDKLKDAIAPILNIDNTDNLILKQIQVAFSHDHDQYLALKNQSPSNSFVEQTEETEVIQWGFVPIQQPLLTTGRFATMRKRKANEISPKEKTSSSTLQHKKNPVMNEEIIIID